MTIPSLDVMLADLAEIAGIEGIDPDRSVKDAEIESIDLLEWLFVLRDERGIDVDESSFDGLDEDATIRDFYDRIVAVAASA